MVDKIYDHKLEIDDEYIKKIFNGAKEYYGDGIYVKSNNQHPCGWDFISFEDFEVLQDMFDQPIENHLISGGCYNCHEYEQRTVADVIKKVGATGWCFEISGVDFLE